MSNDPQGHGHGELADELRRASAREGVDGLVGIALGALGHQRDQPRRERLAASAALAFNDPDRDGDEVPDSLDDCALVANASQTDTDGDGSGDACDCDFDNDGACDREDHGAVVWDLCVSHEDFVVLGIDCPALLEGETPTPTNYATDMNGVGGVNIVDTYGWFDAAADFDGDGVSDKFADNCSEIANPGQQDDDSDGIGNLCDCDFDRDGTCDGQLDYIDIMAWDMCVTLPDYDAPWLGCPAYLASKPPPHEYTGHATDMNSDGVIDIADGFAWFAAAAASNGLPGPSARPRHPYQVVTIGDSWGQLMAGALAAKFESEEVALPFVANESEGASTAAQWANELDDLTEIVEKYPEARIFHISLGAAEWPSQTPIPATPRSINRSTPTWER